MKKDMPNQLHRKQNYRDLRYIPIRTKVQQEIRRPCSQCGKWMIYVVEHGFCRYRFVENNYSIEYNVIVFPWIAVVRRCTNHICVRVKNSPSRFRISKDSIKRRNNAKIITRIQNQNLFYNRRQDNKNRLCIATIQRQMIVVE
jgi:hypothetical protein